MDIQGGEIRKRQKHDRVFKKQDRVLKKDDRVFQKGGGV